MAPQKGIPLLFNVKGLIEFFGYIENIKTENNERK